MKIIFLGPPGVGKGTIATILSKRFNIPKLTTGEMYREEIKKQTTLGKQIEKLLAAGKFAPDEMTIGIMKNRIKEPDCKNGYLLDGFPRNITQAEAYDKMDKIDVVINLYADEDILVTRLLSRRSCPNCKKEYNLSTSMRPKNNQEMCDICHVKLSKRADDTEEVIRHRLEVYENQTKPLVDYYTKKKLLKTVDSTGEPEEIVERVVKVL